MHPLLEQQGVRPITVEGKWCIHSYYTLCPYAPDDSGRLLISGADLKTGETCVMVLSGDRVPLQVFGFGKAEPNFFHTGAWQTWSPDGKSVFYQSGSMTQPSVCRYDLESGRETRLDGADMEGAPPFGEPMVSGLIGMIYAAGYGTGTYLPELAPVPFAERDRHGLFSYDLTHGTKKLVLSVEDVYRAHPDSEKLLAAETAFRRKSGLDGFTLMTYCVRWSPDGERLLFYFGNHQVDKSRGEPRLCYVFTAKRDLSELRLALDLSGGRRGVHWGWHPDGERLIGYAADPECSEKRCLFQVKYDGSDYRILSRHDSGGHPSISPVDDQLLVTDDLTSPGRVVFIDLATDSEIGGYTLPRTIGTPPKGRNPYRVCHHPVFRQDGKKVLVNALPGENAVLCELDVPNR